MKLECRRRNASLTPILPAGRTTTARGRASEGATVDRGAEVGHIAPVGGGTKAVCYLARVTTEMSKSERTKKFSVAGSNETLHKMDDLIDEAIAGSFPASDPPSWTLGIAAPIEDTSPSNSADPSGARAGACHR
jgi:hypothetical protein